MDSTLGLHFFTFNPLQENTYVIFDKGTKDAAIIDPGCYLKSEEDELSKYIGDNELTVRYILNTHGHVDHVLGNYFTKKKYNVPVMIHKKDLETLRAVQAYAPAYGFSNYQAVEPDEYLAEGTPVLVGNLKIDVRFVPGHSPGHVALILEKENCCISGDVLFKHSVGRTDLPGGNFETLIKSIHSQLFTLPDAMLVYPGHGPHTSIGEEKRNNPYCAI